MLMADFIFQALEEATVRNSTKTAKELVLEMRISTKRGKYVELSREGERYDGKTGPSGWESNKLGEGIRPNMM